MTRGPTRLPVVGALLAVILVGLGACKSDSGALDACSSPSSGCPCADAGICEEGLVCLGQTCVSLAGAGGHGGSASVGGQSGAEAGKSGGAGGAVVIGPPNRDVDILFMVDNSGSMTEEQDKIRKSFPVLINALRALPGGLPNLHIGVISSDVGAGSSYISGNPACNRPGGDKGELQVKSGCGLSAQAKFLISLNGDAQNNFTGKLEDVFACIAALGTQGCGFEHQLESIRLALSGTKTPSNEGFLRSDAVLVIILVTDEDDCSGPATSDLYTASFEGQTGSLRCNIAGHSCNGAAPPSTPFMTPLQNCGAAPQGGGRLLDVRDLSTFVFGLKRDPERIIVSAITGVPADPASATYGFVLTKQPTGDSLLDIAPICSAGPDGTAAPSLRIAEFVKAFGSNGRLESICDKDFSAAFGRVAEKIAQQVH